MLRHAKSRRDGPGVWAPRRCRNGDESIPLSYAKFKFGNKMPRGICSRPPIPNRFSGWDDRGLFCLSRVSSGLAACHPHLAVCRLVLRPYIHSILYVDTHSSHGQCGEVGVFREEPELNESISRRTPSLSGEGVYFRRHGKGRRRGGQKDAEEHRQRLGSLMGCCRVIPYLHNVK